MIKSFVRKTLVTAAVALCGAAGLSTSASAGTISIGHTTWVGYGPLFVARELGYFKQAGLDVQLTTIEESSMYMAAMASNKLSGTASTIDEILKYRNSQFCFRSVLALDESAGGDGIVVAKGIQSVKDLKGKAVAVNEGSVSMFWLSYLLKKAGMGIKDIDVKNMTADDAASAFMAGRVPAAVTWEPNLTMVKQKKAGQVMVDSRQTPGVIVDVVALRCDVIDKQPADVRALVDGVNKAVAYMKAHPAESAKIIAKGVGGYLSKPEDVSEALKGVRFFDTQGSIALLGQPGKPGPIKEVVSLANDTWSQLQGKQLKVTYDDLVDTRFLKPAH